MWRASLVAIPRTHRNGRLEIRHASSDVSIRAAPHMIPLACETHHNFRARSAMASVARCANALIQWLMRATLAGAIACSLLIGASLPASAGQPEPAASGQAAQPAPSEAAEGHAEEAEHAGGAWDLAARLLNFGILVGVLVYLLRSPLGIYLHDRSRQVRKDLVAAAEMRQRASEQIAEIDRRLAALPGEIETLRARGAEEIAAEEARIRQAAEAERQRLLEQTKRAIDLQLRVARRELVKDAAELAVGVAAERIKRTITDEDQLRLVDRYVGQVRAAHE